MMLSARGDSNNGFERNQKGSFLLAGLFMFMLFLGVAGLGIDLSRYFLKHSKLQDVADGAALAGANALVQYSNTPRKSSAVNSVLRYIETHQGPAYRDLYEVYSPSDVDGITVEKYGQTGGCYPNFNVNDGSLDLEEPANVKAEIIGSAITRGMDGPDVPVTLRMTVTDENDNETMMEPWGDFDQPEDGDVNNDEVHDPMVLTEQDSGTTMDVTARSWVFGEPHMTNRTGGYLSATLKDEDPVPEIEGFGGQPPLQEFVRDYTDEDKNMVLKDNQAVVFFELGNEPPSAAADHQDVVLLLTVKPPGSEADTGSESTSVSGFSTTACGPRYYRVGVLTYDYFQPYLLPSFLYDDGPQSMVRTAVAEVVARQPNQLLASNDPNTDRVDIPLYANASVALID